VTQDIIFDDVGVFLVSSLWYSSSPTFKEQPEFSIFFSAIIIFCVCVTLPVVTCCFLSKNCHLCAVEYLLRISRACPSLQFTFLQHLAQDMQTPPPSSDSFGITYSRSPQSNLILVSFRLPVTVKRTVDGQYDYQK
jgi:hypothetical protein